MSAGQFPLEWGVRAVTMRQLCTLYFNTLAPVQKPTMSLARPMPNSMLDKGKNRKVIHDRIGKAAGLVQASRP